MGLRIALQHRAQRPFDRLEEDLRYAARRHGTERVAHEPGILHGDEQLRIAQSHADRAPLAQKRLREPAVVLAVEQRTGAAKKVVQVVDVPRHEQQRRLDLLDRAEVEELTQLLDAHELAQEVAVEGERLRAPLLGRRVVLVHVRRDVFEEKRRGEGRRGNGLDLGDGQGASLNATQDPAQRGQVEDVLQHLAIRLEDDRELRVAACDLQQALRLEPLLPERRALAGPSPRDEQRARRILPEPRAVQRRGRELAEEQILDLVGLQEHVGQRRRHVRIGKVERDPVVRPDRLHVEIERIAQPCAQRHCPRRVHAPAERREDAHAPVADLVPETLHDDGAVGRDNTGRGFLFAKKRHEVARGERIERVVLLDPFERCLVGERRQLARGPADLLPELGRAADALALPERRDAGNSRSRRHEHPIPRDLLDPPGRRAEQERLALARLVHHLLVELAHAATAVDEEDTEQAAVGNRSRVRDREPLRAGAPAHGAGRSIPHDPRPQLGELVRWIAAGEHVEDVFELRP